MTAPIWNTPPGSLGTIEEQQFYELQMLAINPEDPEGNDPESLTYKIVSGSLPPGLVMYENGNIQGKPKNLYYIRGVPFDVKEDVTSTFCCRATNSYTKEVTDRTFSLTVTGEDPPEIITPAGIIGTYIDGQEVSIQLEARDLDSEPIAWKISAGSLPPGLSLDESTGIISGFIEPAAVNELAGFVGWSSEAGWEEYPWDYGSRAMSKSYQFSVQATDGKMYDGAKYSIFVFSHDSLTADNDNLTADMENIITSDLDIKRNPVLLTKPADLGTYAHDNYFAYQFFAKDFDDDRVSFSLLVGEGLGFDNEANGFDSTFMDFGEFKLPPGLTLNTETGWLFGQIPRSELGQVDYQFAVRVYKTDYPQYQSGLTYFTMTIINDLKKLVTWITEADLGSMNGGEISEKFVSASNAISRPLLYTLYSGTLPQGLRLNTDGLIVGRTSFEITSMDKDATTFDKNVRELGALVGETTFDRQYSFKVKASDANGELISYKTFSIKIKKSAYDPYESVYLRAQPGLADKEIINQILRNTDLIQNTDLYRNSDPYFGRAKDLRSLLMTGIKASTASEYTIAMATNHYKKSLRIGAYDWARALNDDGSVAYEVVYAKLYDDQMEEGNQNTYLSSPKTIDLSKKIQRSVSVDSGDIVSSNVLETMDGKGSSIVYPASLVNMRSVLRDKLTLNVREPLPRWMTSRQEDGRILGWIPAIPIAYVKPGAGQKVVFNITRISQYDIKDVSFEVDRYIWDVNLSSNYDAITNSFNLSEEVTFDRNIKSDITPVAVADFAVDVPFSSIDGMTTSSIDATGGLDGLTTVYVGKKIIFATQEQYSGFVGEEDGWIRYNDSWDGVKGWDDPSVGFSDYQIIPGYEDFITTSTANQRSAVWEIYLGDNGELRLKVDQYIDLGDAVEVANGYKYGGRILRYGPLIYYAENETVPSYRIYQDVLDGFETVFDDKSTRFIDGITVYQEPDEGDKYLAFPRKNIWA